MRLIDADATLLKMWNALFKLEDEMEQKNGLQPLRRLDVQAGFEAGQHEVANAPTEEERKKGKWIHRFPYRNECYGCPESRECSCCGVWFDWDMPRNSFCPNCGADMREGKTDDH